MGRAVGEPRAVGHGCVAGGQLEETALQIDIEVKRILTEAHETSRRILRDHRETLDILSHRLLEKEVIEAEELKGIIGPIPPKDPDAVPAEIPAFAGMTAS